MKPPFTLPIVLFLFSCASSQSAQQGEPRLVGGPCEGCEAVLEYGDHPLTAIDTLPDFNDAGTLLSLRPEGNMLVGERDFVLGKNIPGYQ